MHLHNHAYVRSGVNGGGFTFVTSIEKEFPARYEWRDCLVNADDSLHLAAKHKYFISNRSYNNTYGILTLVRHNPADTTNSRGATAIRAQPAAPTAAAAAAAPRPPAPPIATTAAGSSNRRTAMPPRRVRTTGCPNWS